MPQSWEDTLRLNVNGPWWPQPPQWRRGYTDPSLPPGQVNPNTPNTRNTAIAASIGAASAGAAWNYSAGPEARARAIADLQKILAKNVGGTKPRKRKSSKGMRRKLLQARGRKIAGALAKKLGKRAALAELGTAGAILAGAATVYDIGKAIYDRVKIGEPIKVLPASGRTTGTGTRGIARRRPPAAAAPGASAKGNAAIVKQAEKAVSKAPTPAAPAVPASKPASKPAKITMKERVAIIKARPAPPPSVFASTVYKYAPKAKEVLLELSKIRNAPKPITPTAPREVPEEFVAAATGQELAPLTSFEGDRVASTDKSKCKCGPKKKRGKRKPRTVCYKGSYTETASGISKRKRERVPCRAS